MPELGNKHECYSCGARFYDFGKPEAVCPKCKANQKDGKPSAQVLDISAARKRRKEEVVRRDAEPEGEVVVPDDDADVLVADDEDVPLDDEEVETDDFADDHEE